MRALRRFVTRLGSFVTRSRHERRMKQEFEQHIALLTEDNLRSGLSSEEARRQALLEFGSLEAMKESYRDQRGLPRLEALIADAIFGWRQLNKHRTASAAAILSLALAIGATTAAFRLIDALLLRTLPVAEPDRLFFVATTYTDRDLRPEVRDDFDYPTFRRYRDAVANQADAMVVGMTHPVEVIFGAGSEAERPYRQLVSGNVFGIFGLQPVIGRLLTPNDDLTPGAHPVAVLSYDFWTRRFARDPGVLGKTFRMERYRIEIVGVAPKGFVGTEPGEVADIFVPAMMNAQAINSPGWSWFRMWMRLKPGVSPEQAQQPLQALFAHDRTERLKGFRSDTPKQVIDAVLKEDLLLLPASQGASRLQKQYRRPLLILSLLVALVLLVACANVANLLAAQASARAREMALRVSIGAGRWRLIQLVLVESTWLAVAASALGALFGSWAAPVVTSMLRVRLDPVRLVLDTGWREIGFSAALALLVTLLFGLAPAFRASAVDPIAALKGSDDPHARGRFMRVLLSAQVALCVLVLFVAGLFLNTFHRLANRPLGFSAKRLLLMDSLVSGPAQPPEAWIQVAEHLRNTPGVESVSISGWPLLSANRWTGAVRIPGRPVEPKSPYFLEVSPRFFETMRISMFDGRDFRPGDAAPGFGSSGPPVPGVGIVNQAFARTYFDGKNPVGRSVELPTKGASTYMEIVGYVGDAAYGDLREPIRPTVYVPLSKQSRNTILVRTASDPEPLAPTLRREVSQARSEFRVRMTQPQENFIRWHLVRERLLATLSLFFAIVALVLSAVGLFGVLNYSVTRQRREIGIRMALGARSGHILRRVTADIAVMIFIGSIVGVAGGLLSARPIEALLYEVKATDLEMIIAPILTLALVAVLAGFPPAMRAARIDPAQTLRNE